MSKSLDQPDIRTRKKTLLEIDGLTFKDLNDNGVLDPYEDWRLPVEERVDDLISLMTLEEKVGLMFHPPLSMEPDGGVSETEKFFGVPATEAILDRHIRHFLNNGTIPPENMVQWSNNVQTIAESSRLGIPLNISSDPRHHIETYPVMYSGFPQYISAWPLPIGLAAARDTDLVRQFGRMAAKEYRALGIHTALHPQADLATEPRWPRIPGTFGEDAELAARLVKAYIEGFQGEKLTSDSVMCMTKHWPGGGPLKNGNDSHNAYGKWQVYPGDNLEYHLKPFLDGAFKAGTAAVMPYYSIPVGYDTVGMNFSRVIIRDMLRQKYGYDGVVCTDWGIITTMPWGVEKLDKKDRYRLVLEAGCDQIGGDWEPSSIIELVNEGVFTTERINQSAVRILKNMFLLGLFEDPYLDAVETLEIVGNREFVEAGKLAQRKSIVLLKNAYSVLPFKPGMKIYMPEVKINLKMIGDEDRYASLVNRRILSEYAEVAESPEDADAAIIKVTAPYAIADGESFAKMHEGTLAYENAFNSEQLEIINNTIHAMEGKPVVVSMFMERPAVLSEFIDDVDAVLATFGVSDEALFDVIFGKFNPVGKLPFDLPLNMNSVEAQQEDVPRDFANHLFEFGYSLSY